MTNRANDWLKQAKRDLKQARVLKKNKGYEWACFLAQQSAEKALKGLHLFLGQEAWGHTISKLLTELPIGFPKELIDKAKILDSFYIPTRYPNGFPEGAPYEHYGRTQAEEAIKYASEIIKFVSSKMAK